ncbi:RNA polymerase sigma factor, sigma-70 family [Micrococcales bacterium KH10]|nr:RNA polymerase sigma factor, sigma-70 family [Micrococcales bacterium KH10]
MSTPPSGPGNPVAAIQHDGDALEAFYREHIEVINRFVARRLSDVHDAADAVADIFVAAVDSAHTYDPQRAAPLVWLYGIGRNVLAARARANARSFQIVARISGRRLLDPDSIARIEERLDAERSARAMYRALSQLSSADRQLVELVAIDDISLVDAAEILGIKANTARVRYHRARQTLQSILSPHHGLSGGSIMNSRPPLNKFEESLLTELRTYTQERSADSAESTVSSHAKPKSRNWLIGVAATGITAIGVAVAFSALAPTPAFAIDAQADGSIIVTVRELSDEAKLQEALAERGIEAEVNFNAQSLADGSVITVSDADGNVSVQVGDPSDLPVGPAGTVADEERDDTLHIERQTASGSQEADQQAAVDEVTDGSGVDSCRDSSAPSVTKVDEGWRIEVPAGSPLRELASKWLVDEDGQVIIVFQPAPNTWCLTSR